MVKLIGKGFKACGPNRNVINLLIFLSENNLYGSELYIKVNEYERDNSAVDSKIHNGVDNQLSRIKITSITSSKERFNFSLNCLRDVYVLNEDTNEYEPKKVYSNYNVIRDGQLVLNKLYGQFSKNVFKLLRRADVLVDQNGNTGNDIKYGKEYIYTINLSNMPLVSLNWAQPDNIGLYDLMYQEVIHMLSRSYAKKLLNIYESNGQVLFEEPNDDIYTRVYNYTKSNSKSDKEKSIEKSNIIYRIPEFNKLELNKIDISVITSQCYDIYSTSNYIKSINKDLNRIRLKTRCIIFAIENSKKKGSYEWSELKKLPRSKDKMYQETVIDYKGNEYTMQRLVY